MDGAAIMYLERSQEITGYRVKVLRKPAFQVSGYTIMCPPEEEGPLIKSFITDLITDGRMETLKKASPVPPWILGLGSWDEDAHPAARVIRCISRRTSTPT